MTRYGKETFRNVGPVSAEYAESVSFSIPGENPDHGQYLDYLPDSQSPLPLPSYSVV